MQELRYPIGSGRVTFSNAKSYMKAVAAAFIEIKTVKFTKKVLHFVLWTASRSITEQSLSKNCPDYSVQPNCSQVQVDPYLEDALCSCCLLRQGPYFCRCSEHCSHICLECYKLFILLPIFRDMACFNYFCRACWELQHGAGLPHHRPIMRNTRGGGNMDRWSHASTCLNIKVKDLCCCIFWNIVFWLWTCTVQAVPSVLSSHSSHLKSFSKCPHEYWSGLWSQSWACSRPQSTDLLHWRTIWNVLKLISEYLWGVGCSPQVKRTCTILYSSCNIHGTHFNMKIHQPMLSILYSPWTR